MPAPGSPPAGRSRRKEAGKRGEDQACAWAVSRGWLLIARNFRSAAGEVDLVALDGDCIVFAEVKAWTAYGIESLERGVGSRKQRRIIETAKYFLDANRKYNRKTVRFDVIFIGPAGITHLPSAFMESV